MCVNVFVEALVTYRRMMRLALITCPFYYAHKYTEGMMVMEMIGILGSRACQRHRGPGSCNKYSHCHCDDGAIYISIGDDDEDEDDDEAN